MIALMAEQLVAEQSRIVQRGAAQHRAEQKGKERNTR